MGARRGPCPWARAPGVLAAARRRGRRPRYATGPENGGRGMPLAPAGRPVPAGGPAGLRRRAAAQSVRLSSLNSFRVRFSTAPHDRLGIWVGVSGGGRSPRPRRGAPLPSFSPAFRAMVTSSFRCRHARPGREAPGPRSGGHGPAQWRGSTGLQGGSCLWRWCVPAPGLLAVGALPACFVGDPLRRLRGDRRHLTPPDNRAAPAAQCPAAADCSPHGQGPAAHRQRAGPPRLPSRDGRPRDRPPPHRPGTPPAADARRPGL
ncbi:hypothetical protein QFZ82_001794 [Streptomyces sp. V4I23]|nr:hypothetical protein [Streptomyces sp. V4I23]